MLDRLLPLFLLLALALAGCHNDKLPPLEEGPPKEQPADRDEPPCMAECKEKECGPDGCGGVCGTCTDGQNCRAGRCWAAECDDGNEVPWDGCTYGRLSERVLNDYWQGGQAHPALALLEDGRFVIAWDGAGPEDGAGAHFRIFGADFQPAGPQRRLHPETARQQEHAALAALPGGGFVAGWTTRTGEKDGDVFAQLFAADGKAAGPVIPLATFTDFDQSQVSLAALPNGGFAATWTSFGQISVNHDIAGRIFDAAGRPVTKEFMVNSTTDDDQQGNRVVVLADGRLLVVWQSKPQDGSLYGVYGRLYDASGEPVGEEFQLNQHTHGFQWFPVVAAVPAGGFVAAWNGEGEGDDMGVFARRFGGDGKPVGPEFRVNQHTDGDQWEAAVAAAPDGSFLVAWENWLSKQTEGEVFVRRYDAQGAPLGDEFQFNVETYDGQGDPCALFFPDGSALLVWYSYVQDGDMRGIFGRRLALP